MPDAILTILTGIAMLAGPLVAAAIVVVTVAIAVEDIGR